METVRILVVDDEILIRETLAECLSGEGYEVSVAASAEKAMEIASKSFFDICLCDIQLPAKMAYNFWTICLERHLKPMCF
jgi:hypothetical protein